MENCVEQKDEIIVLRSILDQSQIEIDATDDDFIAGCIFIKPSCNGGWITVNVTNGDQPHTLTVYNTFHFILHTFFPL